MGWLPLRIMNSCRLEVLVFLVLFTHEEGSCGLRFLFLAPEANEERSDVPFPVEEFRGDLRVL